MLNRTPEELEQLYRNDPEAFRTAFTKTPDESDVAKTWAARLAVDQPEAEVKFRWGYAYPICVATLISLALLIPYWRTGEFDVEWALPFVASFAFLPIMAFHGWRMPKALLIATGMAAVVALLWNLWEDLPSQILVRSSVATDPALEASGIRVDFARQVRDLMMIHWPMLLVGLTGWFYVQTTKGQERVDFVRHAVQVAIMSAIIFAAGMALLGLTNLLFDEMLDWEYMKELNIHLIAWGASGILIFGHAIWLRHPHSMERILPTVAAIFIPLFVMLEMGFLTAQLALGFGELSQDRDQLLVFNLLLVAVIGLVLLHLAFDQKVGRFRRLLVFLLIGFGIIADLMGIAAIGSRLLEWGMTPNRLAVLAGNLIFLGTLTVLLVRMVKTAPNVTPEAAARGVLNRSLVVFVGWTFAVTFLFPLAYGIRVSQEDIAVFEEAVIEAPVASEQETPS